MSATRSSSESSLHEATLWVVRLQTAPALRASREFLDWVAVPSNAERFRAVSEVWTATGRMAAEPEILKLRRRVRRPHRRWNVAAAIAASLVLLTGLWSMDRVFLRTQAFETGVLGGRTVQLSDGSRLRLDADTKLIVRLTPGRRRIKLLRGQAKFEVAHDASRPFTVAAGDRLVLATGTVFDVEVLGQETLVTLLAGRVTVSPVRHTSGPGVVALAPGDRLTARLNGSAELTHVDPGLATAWEDGKLVFDDEPLDEVIGRINRYTPRQWSVDPALRGLRISGLFRAGDLDAFLNALSTYFAVEVRTGADGTIVLRPGAPQRRRQLIRRSEKEIASTG
jgi:transmembrane sensor